MPQADFVVVANRLPVDRTPDGEGWRRSPGGLVTALEPVMRRAEGAWVGWAGQPDVTLEPFDFDGTHLAVVHRDVTPSNLFVTSDGDWYDFDAKYSSGGSRHVVPAAIPQTIADQCMRAAEAAHHALGCRGVSRSDFRYDPKTDRLALLEVNTQPGMTPTSLTPEQAAYVGLTYDQLVQWILEDASWPR